MQPILALIIGSAVGGTARGLVALAVLRRGAPAPFIATLAVNLAGCVLLGALYEWAKAKGLSVPSRALLMTGFCGSFTTFSTLMLESSELISEGEMIKALLLVVGSAAIGLLFIRLGVWTTRFATQ